ncbi:hypothetical protein TNCV_1346351 [Trichonephila clavipes]|nr:hypothetical protein TNCV_1346351 [Trichonephila clavipes]
MTMRKHNGSTPASPSVIRGVGKKPPPSPDHGVEYDSAKSTEENGYLNGASASKRGRIEKQRRKPSSVTRAE